MKYIDDLLLVLACAFFVIAGYSIAPTLALYTLGVECLFIAYLIVKAKEKN